MTTETIITAQRNPRWSVLTDKDDFSGCLGFLRLRSSSSSLRSQKSNSNKNNDDYIPPPRSIPRSNPADSWDPTPPSDLKGYSIAGKSAEILGLSAKNTTPSSRTSSPIPWRSLSGNSTSHSGPSSLRSELDLKASSLRSKKSDASLNMSMRRWPVPMADRDRIVTPADPLDAVRRRLREESRENSVARSSSAPAPARNYSRKWRRSQHVQGQGQGQRTSLEVKEIEPRSEMGMGRKRDSKTSSVSSKIFLDSASSIHTGPSEGRVVDTPIKEDEIPDTNKFDKLLTPTRNNDLDTASLTPSQRSSTRIRSAAFTTFAWMELQANMAPGTAGGVEANRSSWFLVDDKLPSPTISPTGAGVKATGGGANVSKKRASRMSARSGSMDSETLGSAGNDRRNTLEWMGVKPGDFPVPVVSVTTA